FPARVHRAGYRQQFRAHSGNRTRTARDAVARLPGRCDCRHRREGVVRRAGRTGLAAGAADNIRNAVSRRPGPGGPATSSLIQGIAMANATVVLDTSFGAIHIELFADKAPITVENFLRY